ncbi:MAG: translation initiation factor IF-3 [Acidimicrobiia bacterium]
MTRCRWFRGRPARPRDTGGTPIVEPRVNERIRVKRVRLIAPDGGQIGEKDIDEARWLAAQLGLDLVEVAPDARPPVVRLMDYGKYKYDQSVKAREARKNQTRTVVKEVQFRPKIGASDFEVKRKRVVKFLQQGDKVKCTMRFRGREVAHPELGKDILDRLYQQVEDYAEIETMPRLDGRNMTMVLVPAADMPAGPPPEDLDDDHHDDDHDDVEQDSDAELADEGLTPGAAATVEIGEE